MKDYELNLLANYNIIHKALEVQYKNHPQTDIEIGFNTIKFYFPIDGMPTGMCAHAPDDDLKDLPWIKDLRDFVRDTCTISDNYMVNAKDLGNVKYTLPVIVVLEKLDGLKRG